MGDRLIGDYKIEKTLGQGTFGKVKQGYHIFTGQKVAIKILDKWKIDDVNDIERVAREIHILRICLLYTSPSPRDATLSRMPSSA